MALLIEVTSVSAAGKQLRKPINVPRPKRRRKAPTTAAEKQAAFSHGVSVLRGSAKPRQVTAG